MESGPTMDQPSERRNPTQSLRGRRAAQRTISVLPALCTLGNLLCGFGSIFYASRDLQTKLPLEWSPLTFSAVFIFLGMVLDALDGRIARLTHNTSDLGEQLDSMADMVTFGVAPAFLVVELIGVQAPFISIKHDRLFDRVVVVFACIYVACAALRLARFNIELKKPQESSHKSFRGLPSPGAAGTVASLVLLHQYMQIGKPADPMPWSVRLAAFAMVLVMLLVAFAMISRLRYVHVANRYVRGQTPLWKTSQARDDRPTVLHCPPTGTGDGIHGVCPVSADRLDATPIASGTGV